MACNCVTDLESKIPGNANERAITKKKVLQARIKGICFPVFADLGLGFATCQEVELDVEGGKRPVKSIIAHTFCPFCGKKYREDKAGAEEVVDA